MPTFRSTKPASIMQSIATLFHSSPELSGPDIMNAALARAKIGQQEALAEQARAKVEQMRAADTARRDPGLQRDYAAFSSGTTVPEAQRLLQVHAGEMAPGQLPAIDTQGQAAPEAARVPIQPPASVSPQQSQIFNAAMASLIGNQLATGKTNAEQLAKAGTEIQGQGIAGAVQDAIARGDPNAASAMNQGAKPGQPIKLVDNIRNTGATLNPATGAVATDNPLAQAGISDIVAQKVLRDAQAVTEGSKQGELGTRSGYNVAHQGQARAAAAHSGALTQKTRGEMAAGPGATGQTPSGDVARLPGAVGTHLLQQADTGEKFAFNEKTGNAWKATDTGWAAIPINQLPKNVAKIGTGGATQGAREAVFTQRVVTSANQAAKDLANVVQLPLAASTGILGGRKQGPGLFDAGREVLANKMTGQEAQSYNAMATGFQRSLAAIESAGLMPSGTLTHQMDAVLFKEGDTNLTKLHKLAQTRQIIESGMEVLDANPRITEVEKEKIKSITDNVQKAVPFTHSDLIKLQQDQEIKPNTTLNDIVKKKAAGGGDRRQMPRAGPSTVLDQADAILAGSRKP